MRRRTIAHLYNQTAEVRRMTTTSDGMGGQTQTWATVATTPARLSQPSPAAREAAAAAGAQITHDVYLPPSSEVARGDRLAARGLVLTVVAVVEPSEPLYRRAECTSLQHQQ